MSRLRYNNSVGTLGSGLTSTGTTVTFASAPAWSTLVAPDYIVLILEPPGASPSANFEIVYVTAYTAGATTATIVRAQEGTSEVAHASGVAWMVAPTSNDFPTGLAYTPATAPPPSRAYRNAAFSFTANTWTKVPLDTLSFDPNGYMDAVTNHRYNVPASGYYQVDANTNVSSTSYNLVGIYRNGILAAYSEVVGAGGNIGPAAVSDVISCNAGDYLELWIYSSGTALGVTGTIANFLSVVPLTQQSIASQITPVAARAYRSAAFSFPTSTWTKVPIDTVSFDTGGNMDAATNHRFNVPVSGYYQVEAAAFSSANVFTYAGIYKNGVQIAQSGGSSSSDRGDTTDLLFCNAGDYLELWVYSTNGTLGVSAGATGNYLSVAQIAGVPGASLAAARAYRNAALSLTASTWTKVPLDTTSFDPNGYMDVATNHRYNVPAAGPYLVVANAALTITAGNAAYVAIYKNGVAVSQTSTAGASGAAVEPVITDIVQCNAGDYLELWVYSGASSLSTAGGLVNFLSVTPLVSAVTSTPGFGSSGSSSAATNVARAYRGAALSLTSNTWQKIPLDTASFDPSALVSTANGRINIGQAGYYQVNANVQSTSGNTWVGIYKNGSPVPSWGNFPNTAQASQVVTNADIVNCQAGDYLELWVNPGSGTSLQVGNLSGNNWLSIALIQAPSGSGNANALPAGASYQQGVINATDLQLSALAITTGSGQLAFTVGSASQFIGKDASGLLVPMSHASQAYAITPSTLPASTNSIVCGVEIDLNNQVYLAVGASVSGQLSTGIAIATNSPSVTPGRTRIADIGVYNNAGTYEFSNNSSTATQGTNWIDRRPWARGFRYSAFEGNGVAGITTSAASSWQLIGGSFPTQLRVEGSGVPLRVTMTGFAGLGSSNQEWSFLADVDGAVAVGNTVEYPPAAVAAVQFQDGSIYHSGTFYDSTIVGLSPGSHLIRMMTFFYAGGAPNLANVGWTVEEIVRQNANNGTA